MFYALFTACDLVTDIVAVLDVSLSIGSDQNFAVITTFVNSLVSFLEIGPEANLVGVILFARHANISFDVQKHTNADDLTEAVSRIVWSEIPLEDRTGTNTPEALDLLRTGGRSGGELNLRNDDDVTRVAIFLTDGRSNTRRFTGNTQQDDSQNTENAAARLHESGIYEQVYAIGIRGNRNINFRELEFIASDPSFVFIVEDFDPDLFEDVRRDLTRAVCAGKYIH